MYKGQKERTRDGEETRRGAQEAAMAIRKKERMETTSSGMKRGQSDGGGNGGRKGSTRRGD